MTDGTLASVLLTLNIGETVFLLFWPMWWGGYSYGPRLYTDNILVYLLMFLIILGNLNRSRRVKKGLLWGSFFLLSLGLAVNVQGIRNISTLEWNGCPNVDDYPKKIVFDWRFPQFMALSKSDVDRKCLVQSRELGILNDAVVAEKIEVIRNAVLKYLAVKEHLGKIYPLKLEEMGLLPSSFGGYPPNHPGLNWAKGNFWLGNMGDTYGIGYYPSDLKLALFLKNKFSSGIEKIFFPFPEEFNKKAENDPDLFGIIILQFKMPPGHGP